MGLHILVRTEGQYVRSEGQYVRTEGQYVRYLHIIEIARLHSPEVNTRRCAVSVDNSTITYT